MEFHLYEPQDEFERFIGGQWFINAMGKIEPNDDAKFSDFLSKVRLTPGLTVYINSDGGDVEAAIGLGNLVRESGFSTSVGSYVVKPYNDGGYPHKQFLEGRCMSAATLMYLGGRLRYFSVGSRFGVHRFSFRDPSPGNIERSQVLSAKIAAFIEKMGAKASFLSLSSAVSSRDIRELDRDLLIKEGVVTDGTTDVVWSVDARNQTICVRGERDTMFGRHGVTLAYSRDRAFFFWASIEAQGREAELTGFRLVEIVLNDEKVKIDVSHRCQRFVSKACVHVFAPISEAEARDIAFSNSFGVQIRFTEDSPVFLGTGAVSTMGGSEQLQTLFSTLSAGVEGKDNSASEL